MALSTYAELQASVASWMHRTNLTGDIPDFITLSEARIRALLTSRLQNAVTTLSTVAGQQYVTMPNGMLHVISLSIPSVQPNIDYMAPDHFNGDFYPDVGGTPRCYTIIGDLIYFGPTPDAIYTVHAAVSSEFPALTDLAPANTLLAKWPNVYLWGALKEAAKFCRQREWEAGFDADFLQAVDGVNMRDWNVPGPMTVRTDARNP